jgi:hypothetical protein
MDMTTTVKKIKTVAAVFELPQKLGILQYVEYEPPPKEWCVNGCLYEGLLTAEGCACVAACGFTQKIGGGGRRRRNGGGVVKRRWVGALGNRWRMRCGS